MTFVSRIRDACLLAIASGLTACAPSLPDAQVEADFRRSMARDHPELTVRRVVDIYPADGWEGGVEMVIEFDASCATSGTRAPCRAGRKEYGVGYNYRHETGEWEIVGESLLSN